MAIRITTWTVGEATTILVEGRLGASELADLRQVCRAAKPPLHLDLGGLQSADDEGVRLLRSLLAKGVELRGASGYIRELLGVVT